MEVLSDIKINENPFEVTIEESPYSKRERFNGKYIERGEEYLKTTFDLLKVSNKDNTYYEVKVDGDFDSNTEQFIIKNILNSLN